MALTKLGSVKAVTPVLVTSANLASEVTGILPVANGGTGQSTFTDGQLLIGNTTGNTLAKASLTGTANQVIVTPGAGSITLSTPQSIGTGSSPQFAGLLLAAGTLTTDVNPLGLTATWNNSGVTFTALKVNVTDTASNALSKLIDLQKGGVSQFYVDKSGGVQMVSFNASSFASVGGNSVLTTASSIAISQLPALNGFTDAVPALDDRVPIYDTSATANRDAAVAEIVGAGVEGFIQGCKLEYSTTTQIRVTPGMAYIQSSGKILKLAANDDTSPSLSASTWYHVYLFDNSGTVDTEVSTTAPASPWIGTARSKTSDTTRRYLGSFRTNASSQIQNFQQSGGGALVQIAWRVDTGSVTRALSGGTASTATNISLANYVPPTCFAAFVRAINLGDQAVFTDTSDCTGTNVAASSGLLALGNGAQAFLFHPLNSSQTMRYAFAPAPSTGAFYLDVYGFLLER